MSFVFVKNASIEEYFAVGMNLCPTLLIYLTHFKATKNFQVEELSIPIFQNRNKLLVANLWTFSFCFEMKDLKFLNLIPNIN